LDNSHPTFFATMIVDRGLLAFLPAEQNQFKFFVLSNAISGVCFARPRAAVLESAPWHFH
jgi:hypothetical protein